MSKPLISVIIPVYNRAELIERAIHSVLNQTYSNFELIVVNDGSTDATHEKAISFQNCGKLTYIQSDLNHGVSHARNQGIIKAKGEWIAFLDSDDIWDKKKLELQVKHLQYSDFKIAQTQEIWIRQGKRVNPPKTHLKKEGYLFNESLDRCMITPSSVIIHKSLLDEIGLFNETLPACEDYDLWLRITCKYPIGLLDKHLLIRYGGHADQLSSRVFALDRFRIRSLIQLIASSSLNDDQLTLAKENLIKRCTIIAAGYEKHGNLLLNERYKAIASYYLPAIQSK